MGVQPPYLYDNVRTEGPKSPYKEFDPKAVTRASFQITRSKPKQEGPLVSFNQHPDSYLILPYGNTNATAMDPSVKAWIKWMRIVQLVLRCFEFLSAAGQLVFMIWIRNFDYEITSWIMRIAPGVAILHTVYGIYHLSRKSSGRTPGSSASYHIFACLFDLSILPFYAYSAFEAKSRSGNWTTVVEPQYRTTFPVIIFYLAVVGGALHVLSLFMSSYLAITFRKITQLPPDMNPLEDNLTSRHKRNKSSVSTATTVGEKRLSTPLESKRSSGAAYEDLSRPPTIPFFHTRSYSQESFSTYKNTPPASRDSRQDLPSRQYQIRPDSSRSSLTATELKRQSAWSTPPKRTSYAEVPTSENASPHQPRPSTWYASDSFSKTKSRVLTSSKKDSQYQPLHQRYDSSDTLGFDDHPNPLFTNPPNVPSHKSRLFTPTGRDAALIALTKNENNKHQRNKSSPDESQPSNTSGDIADQSSQNQLDENAPRLEREFSTFKAKYYGELKPATPPLMVGKGGVDLGVGGIGRQVSSGNDFADSKAGGTFKVLNPREVSGKVAEEGRGGVNGGWGARLRKFSERG